MKKLLFIIFLGASLFQTKAQVNTIVVHSEEMGKDEVIDLPESMQSDTENMYNLWLKKRYISSDNDCKTTDVNPEVSDSLLMDRLSRIPTLMEMPFNDAVKKCIERYAKDLRKKVSFMLASGNFYIPTFEKALDLYDLPTELKYLPVIESSMDPTAVSRQGATGLWQFMLATGKNYDLQYNSLIDERRDPIKSTWAAAHYLKDLYNIYQDWNLVLAAYNSGPGTVNKAIRRAGGVKDYWKIYNFLPKETRGYVPAFIAANYIMTYYCEHGICPMESTLPEATDTVQINKDLHLQQVSEVCKLDIDELRMLNPQYKKDIIPGNSLVCSLRLPSSSIAAFIDNEKTIFDYKTDELLTKRKQVSIEESAASSKVSSHKAKHHKVRKGDTLGGIAKRYGVSVSQLRRLNHIRGNNITAGKSLRVK